ncbi:MAG: hypothetical protein AB7P76_07480 [Candidatus Melainabacteria bacterium]
MNTTSNTNLLFSGTHRIRVALGNNRSQHTQADNPSGIIEQAGSLLPFVEAAIPFVGDGDGQVKAFQRTTVSQVREGELPTPDLSPFRFLVIDPETHRQLNHDIADNLTTQGGTIVDINVPDSQGFMGFSPNALSAGLKGLLERADTSEPLAVVRTGFESEPGQRGRLRFSVFQRVNTGNKPNDRPAYEWKLLGRKAGLVGPKRHSEAIALPVSSEALKDMK